MRRSAWRRSRLYAAGRAIPVAEPVRTRLTDYLTPRHQRWPNTTHTYCFVTSRTALSTTPVSRPWLYRHHPASTHLLRGDRILDEAQADGNTRMTCEMFGLSFKAATRYNTPPPSASLMHPTTGS
ncbi:hypothetical protein AB0N17_33575 [Streptomyces sp. NPDC051133]|uniref:hypothetical protein n=1 Tax=Streptomyces sp. NPDC051133 TaxID=3155521 RepID=UPI003443EA10